MWRDQRVRRQNLTEIAGVLFHRESWEETFVQPRLVMAGYDEDDGMRSV